MKPIIDWFKWMVADDGRRANRRRTPPLVAYFWDGGRPVAHDVRNISPTGFYLVTTERWLLGTLIMMTLQRTSTEISRSECSVIVMSKVVRYGEDGVGFSFVPVETTVPGQQPGPGAHAADKRTLEKFLHLLLEDQD
jgi:PilZ domain